MDDQVIWPWVTWLLGTAVSFGLLEYRGLKDPNDIHPPLTQVIKHFAPRWAIATVLGAFAFWGFEHFIT